MSSELLQLYAAHCPSARQAEMDLDTFRAAVQSMSGWYRPGKVLGLIGGEPTLQGSMMRSTGMEPFRLVC